MDRRLGRGRCPVLEGRVARILLIDDDAEVRLALRQALEFAGHVVEEARDGRDGVERYSARMADLVVTDIVMPNQEGIETIQQLRELTPALPIIAISGGGRTGNRDVLAMAAEVGASRTMAKPFRPRELIQAIAGLLTRPAAVA
jgi:CheY-like chemotaxis protein